MNIIGGNPNYEQIGTPLQFAIKNKYIYIPKGQNIDDSRRYLYDKKLLKILLKRLENQINLQEKFERSHHQKLKKKLRRLTRLQKNKHMKETLRKQTNLKKDK